MSFALTTRQVRARSKDVTRRNGWRFARAGMIVQPIIKGQGLKRGERVRKIGGPIRFLKVTREPLGAITARDVEREGFHMTPAEFVALYIKANGGTARQIVTRIAFEYLEAREVPGARRRRQAAA